MLNAAVVVANHQCLRHQPLFLSSRRLRRISRANAVLRGLNSLGSRPLRSSIVVNLARLSVGSAARAAWRVLYAAQQQHTLATTGPYAHVRHPQYVGFVLIMFGFLLQWPTLLTLAMFPVLVWMYVHLARQEEREARAQFGEAYAEYARRVPAFVPRMVGRRGEVA